MYVLASFREYRLFSEYLPTFFTTNFNLQCKKFILKNSFSVLQLRLTYWFEYSLYKISSRTIAIRLVMMKFVKHFIRRIICDGLHSFLQWVFRIIFVFSCKLKLKFHKWNQIEIKLSCISNRTELNWFERAC